MENMELNVEEILEPTEQPESRQEFIDRKKSEKEQLGMRADAMIEQALSSPSLFGTFLEKKHAFGKSSINTLLILDQCPDATMVKTFKEWLQQDLPEDQRLNLRAVKRGATGIKVFEKNGEYTKPDGSIGNSYKVVHVFDISQTYGGDLPEAKPEQPHIKKLFRALTHKTKLPMRMSSSVDKDMLAQYTDGAVLIAPQAQDGNRLFARVAEEYTKAICGRDGEEAAFIARSVAFLVSKKYGIDFQKPERIPDSIKDMDISEKRALMYDIHTHASKATERINDNLRKQPELEHQAR